MSEFDWTRLGVQEKKYIACCLFISLDNSLSKKMFTFP